MQNTSTFHLVQQPDNWQQHDQQQGRLRENLRSTAHIAEARRLDRSAERFRPSPDLLNAINASIASRSPLLLTGEPGTGKTQVAWFLQRYFGIRLFEYQVRSNSQSADLRYDFDAVAYLRDAYLAQQAVGASPAGDSVMTDGEDPRSHPKYLKPGPLWQAYDLGEDCLLLIDEIDKAPRDFPNDLLQEIDQHRFAHPFHKDSFVERKGPPPIIIITSNAERRLPDAFLRRCIVHHIELTDELLKSIMQAWEMQFPHLDQASKALALQRFQDIRKLNRLSKKPGAAELLLWLSVLSAQRVSSEALDSKVALKDLPALMCLIKDHADYVHLA
ncbi:MAG: MoxR family ATPase [Gammaproteobacteria bacterium]|nr:MoxR family ATPase [Gammaproteobacteria bacterium]MBU1722922.1 MoxR family ATPase [Gammaproteobacteria bacterium]MBU2005701.1 MoxR family ATPase [Gammaproteobacteria bacterium]